MSNAEYDIAVILAAGQPGAFESLQAGEAKTIAEAAEAIVLEAERGDVGAPFTPLAAASLRAYQAQDIAGWRRLRDRLRTAGVGVVELDKQLKGAGGVPNGIDAQNGADKVIALARERCNVMHDAQGEAYAVFEVEGARQIYAVSSSGFSEFLSHAHYRQFDRAPGELALKVALATLRGQAKFDGDTCAVHTRIAKNDAAYWLDLCDDDWQSVRITAEGWDVVRGGEAPLFTRSSSMRPLPLPERGGTLEHLWPLVNIPVLDRLMCLAWMLECLRPDTPHVVLELVGEQGSAKSSTQSALRRLIDPNQADLRAAPRSVEDVWISARNAHLVSLENLSHLPSQYQDALCVLATGGGYAGRTLYTNVEETIVELRKPIVLNGISVIVTAQDLLDRCLHIDLPSIQHRALAGEITTSFEAARPLLLGALLDLFVKVLVALPSVTIPPEQRPRMADFALLGEAVYRVHGEPPGAFLARYNAMRKEGVLRTIDASPVGAALVAYLTERPDGYAGSLTELLQLLERYRTSHEAWPRSAKGLGDALRRLSPALRLIGVECVSLPKTGGVIRWSVRTMRHQVDPSPDRPASPADRAILGAQGQAVGMAQGHAGHAGLGPGGSGPGEGMSMSQAVSADFDDAEEF